MALGMTKMSGTPTITSPVGAASTNWAAALDAGVGERFRQVVVQVSLTFDAAATGDGIIHMRKSADGGTTDDNLNTGMITVTAPSSTTPQVVTLEAADFDYLEIGVENQDAVYTLAAVVKYEGDKVTGMA